MSAGWRSDCGSSARPSSCSVAAWATTWTAASPMPMARASSMATARTRGGVAGGAGQAAIEERGERRRQPGFRARLALAGLAHQRRLREHRALELAIAGAIVGRRVAPLERAVDRAHHRAARQRRLDLLDRTAPAAEAARRLAARAGRR